jgi:hypothetical protein
MLPKKQSPTIFFLSQPVTEIESCYFRQHAFELPSFYVQFCKDSRLMTPLLLRFTLESTSDSRNEQSSLIELLVAEKETIGNTHKRLSTVYGLGAL